jgi:hypothetical protein
MADILGITPEQVFGHLFRVWVWADQQSLNGHAISVTEKGLDRVSRHAGLATAMREVGWLTGKDGAITFPNFERHNGETAKKRALAAKRKVTERSRSQRDSSVTREDKRKNSPIPPSGAFLRFWAAWPKSHRKQAQGKCLDIWQRSDLDQVAPAILAHVDALKASEDWKREHGKYIPAPLVYLNQKRWEGAETPEPQAEGWHV